MLALLQKLKFTRIRLSVKVDTVYMSTTTISLSVVDARNIDSLPKINYYYIQYTLLLNIKCNL